MKMAMLIDRSNINYLRVFDIKRNLLKSRRSVACRMMKLILCLVSLFFLSVVEVSINEHSAEAASMLQIVEGDEWQYYKGTITPPKRWNTAGFDDSAWSKGPSGFGYGMGQYATLLTDMRGNYLTVYARRNFIIENPSAVKGMYLSIICDGPFVAYINGRKAIGGTIPMPHGRLTRPEQLDISGLTERLHTGINVLAVQCSNDDIYSDDFSFAASFDIVDNSEGGL